MVSRSKKNTKVKKSAPSSGAERQRRFREKEAKLNAVEPRLKLLRGHLLKIQEGGGFSDKVKAIEIVGQILHSDRHGLLDVSMDSLLDALSETGAWALNDCIQFDAEEARKLNQQQEELQVEAENESAVLYYWRGRIQDELAAFEADSEDGQVDPEDLKNAGIMLNVIDARLVQLHRKSGG